MFFFRMKENSFWIYITLYASADETGAAMHRAVQFPFLFIYSKPYVAFETQNSENREHSLETLGNMFVCSESLALASFFISEILIYCLRSVRMNDKHVAQYPCCINIPEAYSRIDVAMCATISFIKFIFFIFFQHAFVSIRFILFCITMQSKLNKINTSSVGLL